MNNNKRLAINIIAQMIAFAVNITINFLLTPYVIQVIGKEVYGFVGLSNNFVIYITIFTVSFNAMLSRFVTVKLNRKEFLSAQKYFSSIAIINTVLSIIIIPLSIIFVIHMDRMINVPSDYSLHIKFLWIIVFSNFAIRLAGNVFSVATYASNRLDISALINVGSYLTRAILLIVLFKFFPPYVWYVGLAYFLCSILEIIINIYYTRKLTPELKISKKYFDWKSLRELISFGIWNSINQLNDILMTGLDLFMANLFFGAMEMSLLSIAKSIPNQLIALIDLLSYTFAPQLTSFYTNNDKNSFVNEINFTIKLVGFVCSVPIIGFVIFGRKFFTLWLPNLSVSEANKIQMLSILTLLPITVSAFVNPLYNINTITCKLKVPALFSFILGVLNIIIVCILVKTTSIGIYAIAGVSSFMILLRELIFVPLYAAKSLQAKWHSFCIPIFRGLGSIISLAFVFYLFNYFITVDSWLMFAFACVVSGGVGYIINLFIIFQKQDRKNLINIFYRKIKNRLVVLNEN